MFLSQFAGVSHDNRPKRSYADFRKGFMSVLNAIQNYLNDLIKQATQAIKEARKQLNQIIEGILA